MRDNIVATDKGKQPNPTPGHVRFQERPTCTIAEASAASGLSRSTLYNEVGNGQIGWTKIGARRLIRVQSLLDLLGVA